MSVARIVDLRKAAELAIGKQCDALELFHAGELEWTADDPDCPDVLRLAALGEEFGEVCQAVHDDHPDQLRAELAQLAGVALAWMVALER